ncbi:MAG: hypothetical protein GY835_10765 [bacterium]|nr:hypothetical protein [bacterium]
MSNMNLFALFFAAALTLFAVNVLAADDDIVIGKTITLQSQVLGEDVSVMVSLPRRYEVSTAEYPVLYVLEGYSQFLSACAIVGFHSNLSWMPPIIVVGIRNPNRNRYLTPSTTAQADRERFPGCGEATEFRSFIGTELMPFIDEEYRTAPFSIVVGHSLGGLFAVDTLLNAPDLFDAYIAASPSLWWDGGSVVAQAELVFTPDRSLPKRLFLTHGNENADIVTGVHQIKRILEYHAPVNMRWEFGYLPQNTHGATPFRSILDGLSFIYRDWRIHAIEEELSIEEFRNHYDALSEDFGYDCLPTERFINGQGYMRLQAGRLDDALDLFLYNVENYPLSANVHDSLGEARMAADNTEAAIASYERSLELDPDNANAVTQLKRLRRR